MKFTFTVTLLLLATASQAAESISSRSKQKEESKTDKRALVEGNAALEKRAPVLSTAQPSEAPGIVYADSNELQSDQSPKQETYVTPYPQLAKISDVLTGQGPPFQAAIASHLFSPVSVYQTRLPGYEVSAPIPSQLAYSDKITTYQRQPAQQFRPQIVKETDQTNQNLRQAFQQLHYQSQPQGIQDGQPIQIQQLGKQYQPSFQNQPQFLPFQQLQPQFYSQPPFPFQHPFQLSPQPLAYFQQQIASQPGILYARQENEREKSSHRDLETIQRPQQNIPQKAGETLNPLNQGAVSYASFSVGPSAPPQQKHLNKPQTQPQLQSQSLQYQQPQTPQYQLQPQYPQPQPRTQQYQLQPQPAIQQYQPHTQPLIIHYSAQLPAYQPQQIQQSQPQQYQPQQLQQSQPQQYQLQQQQYQVQENQNKLSRSETQSRNQYQIERIPSPAKQNIQYHQEIKPKINQNLQPTQANTINIVPKRGNENDSNTAVYYRPEALAYQPQVPQIPVYPGQDIYQNTLTPRFPPVQFFGKFAHELFKNLQQPQ